jgi:hypothetical protein
MIRATLLVLAVGTAALVGCSSSSAPPAAPFQVSWDVRDGNSFTKGTGAGAYVRVGPHTLEIRDHRVILNGKAGGELKSGDKVLVDTDGRLFVNGEERTPK